MNKSTLFKSTIAGLVLGIMMTLFCLHSLFAPGGYVLGAFLFMLFPVVEPTIEYLPALPVAVLQITLPLVVCGGDLASDLFHSAPYRMTREANRTRWYIRTTGTMLVAAYLYVSAYAFFTCTISCFACVQKQPNEDAFLIVRIGATFIMSMGSCITVLLLLSSIIAILGTTGSMLAITVALELVLFILAIALSNFSATWSRLLFAFNPICCGMISWYDMGNLGFEAVTAADGLKPWMCSGIVMLEWAIVVVWGWNQIRYKDIL